MLIVSASETVRVIDTFELSSDICAVSVQKLRLDYWNAGGLLISSKR